MKLTLNFSKFKSFIIDLDGCVYRGEEPIEGAGEAISLLRRRGFKILFLTNNSTKTPEEYVEILRSMDIPVTSRNEVLTSAIATARYLRDRYGECRIFPVGMQGLLRALEECNHQIIDEENIDNAEFVVVGLDMNFNYQKLSLACRAIMKGAKFIATNTDSTLPSKAGLLPGAGAIVNAIKTVTGVEPVVIGKPSRIIMDVALKVLDVNGDECVVIGDRLDTDITAGKKIGAYTVLVLTGVIRKEDLEGLDNELKPDLVLESIADLKKLL